MKLYHGTRIGNVTNIKKEGLVSKFEGVYLTDSIDSAARWTFMRAMGDSIIAIIEIDAKGLKLEEGTDHSPLMVQLFGVGKSILSTKNIAKSRVKKVHYLQIAQKESNEK